VIDLFVEHLDSIGVVPRISLLLQTNGGNTSAAWRIINLLHTFCNELEVIIPLKALSAGTLMSLGADKIVMTKQAALGPIDPSLDHPLNPTVQMQPGIVGRVPVSVEAVNGYLDFARNDLKMGEEAMGQLLTNLASQVHPLVLGQIFRSRAQIRFLAKKLLPRQVRDPAKIDEIIAFLCADSGSHDYTINRREARELGLTIENPSEAEYKTIRSIQKSFSEEMNLLTPFDPNSTVGQNPFVNSELLTQGSTKMSGFGANHGAAAPCWAGESGKARPIRRGGRIAKRTCRREPGRPSPFGLGSCRVPARHLCDAAS